MSLFSQATAVAADKVGKVVGIHILMRETYKNMEYLSVMHNIGGDQQIGWKYKILWSSRSSTLFLSLNVT